MQFSRRWIGRGLGYLFHICSDGWMSLIRAESTAPTPWYSNRGAIVLGFFGSNHTPQMGALVIQCIIGVSFNSVITTPIFGWSLVTMTPCSFAWWLDDIFLPKRSGVICYERRDIIRCQPPNLVL